MLMCDDVGVTDWGCYSGGGKSMGHPTPNIDKMAKEGATFTKLVMASRVAPQGAPRSITGRIPIRTALLDRPSPQATRITSARKSRPSPSSLRRMAMALTSPANWHLGDKPCVLPIEQVSTR